MCPKCTENTQKQKKSNEERAGLDLSWKKARSFMFRWVTRDLVLPTDTLPFNHHAASFICENSVVKNIDAKILISPIRLYLMYANIVKMQHFDSFDHYRNSRNIETNAYKRRTPIEYLYLFVTYCTMYVRRAREPFRYENREFLCKSSSHMIK